MKRLYSKTASQTYIYCYKPYIPFCTLDKLVDVEDNTIEKIRSLGLPLEINNRKSKLGSRNSYSETNGPNPEKMFSQTTDLNNQSKPHFRNFCIYYHKSKHSGSNSSKRTTFILLYSINHKIVTIQKTAPTQEIDIHISIIWFWSPSISRSRKKYRFWYGYRNWDFRSIRTRSSSRYTDFYKQRRSSRYPYYVFFSEIFIVLFLDLTQTESILKIINLHNNRHQDQFQDMRLHVAEFLTIKNHCFAKIMISKFETCRSRKTNLKLTCKALKWQSL